MGSICKIAVSGGAASGKSSVCEYFRKKGIRVISLDSLSREVVLPGAKGFVEIVKYFGDAVVLSDGELDRALLRKFITEKPELKKIIEGIVQPEIIKRMNSLISEYEAGGEPFVVVEVPLLYELGMEDWFDACILVCIDSSVQVERLMQRDGVTKEEAYSLIDIQMPQAEKMKRAEFVVENTGGLEALFEMTHLVFKKIVEKTRNMSK